MKKTTIALIVVQSILIISLLFSSIPLSLSVTKPKVVWSKTYEVSAPIDVEGEVGYSQSGRSVVQTSDGGYAIVGKTVALYGGAGFGGRGPPSERDGGVLIKTDSGGILQWYVAFPFEPNYPYSIIQTKDLGFLVSCQPHLIKFNNQGDIQWSKNLGISILRMFSSNDNTYVLTGTSSISYDKEKGWLLKIDGTGDVLMNKTLTDHLPIGENLDNNSINKPYIFDITATKNDDYVSIGTWSDSGSWSFKTNLWFVKVDSKGNLLLNKTYSLFNVPSYSPLSESVALSVAKIQETSDGDFVVSGRYSTRDFYAPWIAKIDSMANLEFAKSFANSWWNSSYFVSSVPSQDSGLMAVGILGPGLGYTNDQTYPLLLGTDELGNEEWRLTYHSSWWNSNSSTLNRGDAISVIPLIEGDYAIAGTVNGRVWLTKINLVSNSASNGPTPGTSALSIAPLIIVLAVILAIISIIIFYLKSARSKSGKPT